MVLAAGSTFSVCLLPYGGQERSIQRIKTKKTIKQGIIKKHKTQQPLNNQKKCQKDLYLGADNNHDLGRPEIVHNTDLILATSVTCPAARFPRHTIMGGEAGIFFSAGTR